MPRAQALGRFRRDDDIARDDLRSQVLDLRADVVDESAAVAMSTTPSARPNLPDPRHEDAPRVISEHLIEGDVHSLHHRGEHVGRQGRDVKLGRRVLWVHRRELLAFIDVDSYRPYMPVLDLGGRLEHTPSRGAGGMDR
jgi:hypothetical protein